VIVARGEPAASRRMSPRSWPLCFQKGRTLVRPLRSPPVRQTSVPRQPALQRGAQIARFVPALLPLSIVRVLGSPGDFFRASGGLRASASVGLHERHAHGGSPLGPLDQGGAIDYTVLGLAAYEVHDRAHGRGRPRARNRRRANAKPGPPATAPGTCLPSSTEPVNACQHRAWHGARIKQQQRGEPGLTAAAPSSPSATGRSTSGTARSRRSCQQMRAHQRRDDERRHRGRGPRCAPDT
jgi:hypothetical protein